MSRFFLAIIFQGCALWVNAQLAELYFNKLTIENGLSNNKVKCILQDKRGFIWVGTEDGLNRFDGTHFVVFRHQPSNNYGISGNIISDILEDKEGILWIATQDGGLNRYDYRLPPKDQFRQFKHLPHDTSSIPVNGINAMLQDTLGNIWLATSGASVIRFNKAHEKFDYKVKIGRTVYDLCLDEQGIIWAGREGGSILKIDPLTTKYESQKEYENYYLKLPHVVVTCLFRDNDNDMWYGSWDRALYRYNNSTRKEETFASSSNPFSFSDDEALSFKEDDQQRIWIAGKNHGLYLFDKKEQRFYNYRHDPLKEGSVASNTINCIFNDQNGNTWLGTNAGISIFSPLQQQFNQVFLQPIKDNPDSKILIYDFFEDDDSVLWIGTSKGIFINNPSSGITYIPVTFNNIPLQVSKFFQDDNGNMYIGTNYSLFRFDKYSKKALPLENMDEDVVMKKLIESRIVSVLQDTINNNPVLIVSPYGHFLAYYDLVNNHWVSRQDTIQKIQIKYNIKENLVRKLVRSKSGKIWMANLKEGLGEWQTSSGTPIRYYINDPQSPETISNNNVFDIIEDENNLWVSTYGGGLNYFDTDSCKFSHVASVNNLLEGIKMDEHANIWIISNGNLHRYNNTTQVYTSFELPDIEKSGGVKGYIYKARNQKMYMAGTNYYIAFHPDSVRILETHPLALFTDFKIFNNSYSDLLFKDSIVLQYDQNFFSLEFSAPYFSMGSDVQYSYMLEGVDKNWIDAGTRNFASYSNISSGLYHFKVQATANRGISGNQYATIAIRIIPPFWERWWFYLLCAMMVLLIIYTVYRYRINELVKRQAMRNKIAKDLHDNVGSTLSSISIYSQVAQIQSQQHNENELTQILDKIGLTSNEMISEMNDIVWAINPRNDNMEKIIQRMESFARPLLAAKNIQFNFNFDPALLNFNLDMGKRKNFYLIFKEAINNTVKYSCCENLTVDILVKKHHIDLVVKDDGIGFIYQKLQHNLKNSLSGNGIRNMQLRAQEMKGKYTITSEPGKGTEVFLTFPIT
ncbi:MAG: two-component regulator propeller domain-containing protein [Chitinophagaceae bacterium]